MITLSKMALAILVLAMSCLDSSANELPSGNAEEPRHGRPYGGRMGLVIRVRGCQEGGLCV